MVLQPAAEAEKDEVRGAALTGGRRRCSAVPRRWVRLLSWPLSPATPFRVGLVPTSPLALYRQPTTTNRSHSFNTPSRVDLQLKLV